MRFLVDEDYHLPKRIITVYYLPFISNFDLANSNKYVLQCAGFYPGI